MPRISHIVETCIYAKDLAAAEAFYGGVLGLERMTAEFPRHVFFRVNERDVLLVFNPEETIKKQDIPSHGPKGPGHFAFAVERDQLDRWREHLTAHDVDIEREIRWPNGARSIYVRDPAGNSVEFVTSEIWNT